MMLARHSSRKSSGGHFGGKTNSGGMFSLTMDKMRILAISEVSTAPHHTNSMLSQQNVE